MLRCFRSSAFHFPASLRSTVITRFVATTDALTPGGRLFGPCFGLAMNAVLSRRVSLITARRLPTIPSPTIGGATGDSPGCPACRLCGLAPALQASSFPSRLARVHRPNRVHLVPVCRDHVTDWSFSFRCSPPRLAATQLRFDTPRLIAAGKRTSTVRSARLLRRTGDGALR